MTVKNWCSVLLSSVAIAIAIPEQAFATSYIPCGYIFYDNADKIISPTARADEIINPTAKAEAYYLAANDCHRHAPDYVKDWYTSDAVKYYTKAIALNPGIAKTYLSYIHLGEIHRENEDYSQSLENYSLAIASIPNLPRAYNGRAKTYALMTQKDLALADYIKAIDINANAASFLGRGNVYLSLNQKSKAIADYTKAMQRGLGGFPAEPKAQIVVFDDWDALRPQRHRGYRLKVATQRWRECAVQEAIAIQPNFADAYIVRGDTYRSLKYDKKAIFDYSQAITLLKNAIAKLAVGIATYSDNDYTSPVGVGLGDKLAKVYLQRAELYRQIANYQQAVQDYQESDFLKPLPTKFYLGRAEAYRQTKQYQKALNDYLKIIAINRSRERAEAYLGMGYIYRDRQQRRALDNFKRAAYLFERQGNTAKYQTALEEMSKL